jgi:hypothetical protein
MGIPEMLAPLFKNYDTPAMDLKRSAELIVLTVLARGTLEQISFLFTLYSQEEIKTIFRHDFFGLRTLPAPTVSLWGLLFLDETERQEYTRWYQNPAQRWAPRRKINTPV